MFVVKLVLIGVYLIGLRLTWDIVMTNLGGKESEAELRGVEFKINWFRELVIGLLIWIFTPVWLIIFVFRIIKLRK